MIKKMQMQPFILINKSDHNIEDFSFKIFIADIIHHRLRKRLN